MVTNKLIGTIIAPALLKVIITAPQGHHTSALENNLVYTGVMAVFFTFFLVLHVLGPVSAKRWTVSLLERSLSRLGVAAWIWLSSAALRDNNPTHLFGVALGFSGDQHWLLWAGPILTSLFATRISKELEYLSGCEDTDNCHQDPDFPAQTYKKPLEDHSDRLEAPARALSLSQTNQVVSTSDNKEESSLSIATLPKLETPCSTMRLHDEENCLALGDDNSDQESRRLVPWASISLVVLCSSPLLVLVLPAGLIAPRQ